MRSKHKSRLFAWVNFGPIFACLFSVTLLVVALKYLAALLM
jgi:hypothetical protein